MVENRTYIQHRPRKGESPSRSVRSRDEDYVQSRIFFGFSFPWKNFKAPTSGEEKVKGEKSLRQLFDTLSHT